MAKASFIDWKIFFYCALAYNLGLLLVNQFFLNAQVLEDAYPEVFSKFSQLIIILFGFIYYFAGSNSKSYELMVTFGIVKSLYFLSSVYWILFRSHLLKFEEYPREWFFMRVYGAGDLAFGILFFYHAVLI